MVKNFVILCIILTKLYKYDIIIFDVINNLNRFLASSLIKLECPRFYLLDCSSPHHG